MKFVIGFCPYQGPGTPQISQNRQFNWNKAGTVIYPVILASCATMLSKQGHSVKWLDGIAERMSWDEYLINILREEPDYILWEVKTPVIKKTWEYVNEVKEILPNCKVILCGDHVTALPDESYKNCSVDYILLGGDYDNLLFKYLNCPNPPRTTINRSLTRYELYAKKNGNFQSTPGSYTMFARDCVHRFNGGCSFCSWTNMFRGYSVQSVEGAMEEIEVCSSLGIKEVFDDSGTFPTGAWLHSFAEKLIKFNKGRKNAIKMGCNMRPGVLSGEDWKLLKRSGFRLILMGLESANERTLEKVNKGYKLADIVDSFRLASGAGLDVHGTAMVGFPWECRSDAERTIGFTKDLFAKGHAKTIQATVCVPYPGTRLFEEAKEKGWLLTEDWDRYDQSQAVMRTEGYDPVELARGIYRSCLTPRYLVRSLLTEKPSTLWRYAGYLWNHLKK